MRGLAVSLVVLVAVLQTSFLILEMFLLETPIGLKTFNVTAEQAATMATLAKNQGLYNGLLAAGLLWGLSQGLDRGRPVIQFFLGCAAVAGLYGGATAGKMIWGAQMLPALIAMGALLLAARTSTAARPGDARGVIGGISLIASPVGSRLGGRAHPHAAPTFASRSGGVGRRLGCAPGVARRARLALRVRTAEPRVRDRGRARADRVARARPVVNHSERPRARSSPRRRVDHELHRPPARGPDMGACGAMTADESSSDLAVTAGPLRDDASAKVRRLVAIARTAVTNYAASKVQPLVDGYRDWHAARAEEFLRRIADYFALDDGEMAAVMLGEAVVDPALSTRVVQGFRMVMETWDDLARECITLLVAESLDDTMSHREYQLAATLLAECDERLLQTISVIASHYLELLDARSDLGGCVRSLTYGDLGTEGGVVVWMTAHTRPAGGAGSSALASTAPVSLDSLQVAVGVLQRRDFGREPRQAVGVPRHPRSKYSGDQALAFGEEHDARMRALFRYLAPVRTRSKAG